MPSETRFAGVGELLDLPLGAISRNAGQPRQRIDPVALLRLAGSLEERGVIEPVIVRPIGRGRFELVAGERRWRAALLIGLDTIPAVVRDLDDDLAFEVAVIENMARDDMTPIEEARSVALLCERRGLSKAEVARRVGRSRAVISNLVRLLELPDEAQRLINEGRLTAGHGRALLLCRDFDRQRQLARRAVDGDLSVRELERAAHRQPPALRKPAVGVHPDQAAFATELEDGFTSVLGRDARVEATTAGEFRLLVDLGDAREAQTTLKRARAGNDGDAVDDDPLDRW
ncbi:MAG: ParB/RepB/Spo0J family partition protein [Solirubrobacteraceae bacterium]